MRIICVASAAVAAAACLSLRGTETGTPASGGTLAEIVQRVIERNEGIQIKAFDTEIGRKTHQAEKAIFEPQVVASLERTDQIRPNNTQQLLSLGFSAIPELRERNSVMNGGLEFLTPVGTRLRTGYTLRELGNNLQRTTGLEYETFVGASLVQPLLKNFGTASTMARIRLAALASEVAFQEYRRELMLLVAQAEATYWDLFSAQEEERISQASLETAQKVLADNRVRAELGKASELEVLQAEAGVALRRSQLNEATLKAREMSNRLRALMAEGVAATNAVVVARDRPQIETVRPNQQDDYVQAFQSNPDYLARQRQAEQEDIRVKYARNQAWPALDLKASYGLNGLGNSAGDSMDDIQAGRHPAWSLGLELRLPITGGIRERRELEAAKLSQSKALLGLKQAQVQIFNALDMAAQRVLAHHSNVQSHGTVAEFHQRLLTAQLARLEVGTVDSRAVLETEAKLAEARTAVAQSQVMYRKARLDWELAQGSLLRARSLDPTRAQLEAKTKEWVQQSKLSERQLRDVQHELQKLWDKRISTP